MKKLPSAFPWMRGLVFALGLTAVSVPSLQAVETKVQEGDGDFVVSNVLGKLAGEPKLVDLTGTHTFNFPMVRNRDFGFLELVVKLRHMESGELRIASATLFYGLRSKLNQRERCVFKPRNLRRAGGRVLPDRTLRLWLDGEAVSNDSAIVELDLALSGKVDLRPRNGALDLRPTGSVTISVAKSDGKGLYVAQLANKEMEVRSEPLLRNLEVWTQIGRDGHGGRPVLSEGWMNSVTGPANQVVQTWGYLPFRSPLKGRIRAALSSNRLAFGNSQSSWIQFEMNGSFKIVKMAGRVAGQDIEYPRP